MADVKGFLKDSTVLVLLVVAVLNLICCALVYRFSMFVHGDLYNYGLIFSLDWAEDFYYSNTMLWIFLDGAIVLSFLSIIPHRQYSIKPSKASKWLGFLLPSITIIYQALSIMYFWQMNDIVKNRLGDFGLISSVEWTSTVSNLSNTIFALMIVAILILLIPTLRTIGIMEIEIVKEEELENKPKPIKKSKPKKKAKSKKKPKSSL
ncbi:MAG: hypothetical protein AC479_07030 [miscellaneous Crenarchaeota group-6 archaeon AD8-1]|nr:MAG: hypothetical protein AC479_07030 [miscellaneous Crenarchaeota group-6 archaeon AD8-1]